MSVSVLQSVLGSATATGYFCQRSVVCSWFCHSHRVCLSALCSLFLVLPRTWVCLSAFCSWFFHSHRVCLSAFCSWFFHSHRVCLSTFWSLFLVLPQPQGVSVSVVQSVLGSATTTGCVCQRSAVCSWFCHSHRVCLSTFCSLF